MTLKQTFNLDVDLKSSWVPLRDGCELWGPLVTAGSFINNQKRQTGGSVLFDGSFLNQFTSEHVQVVGSGSETAVSLLKLHRMMKQEVQHHIIE